MKRKMVQNALSVWIVVMVMIFFINRAQAYEEVSGVIPNGTVWTTGMTYYVIDSVTISAGTLLTIEPDVVVKFAPGKGMTITGTVVSEGQDYPTHFTSKNDDDVGDIIDGSSGTPFPNDWGYLYPNGVGSSSSVLDYAIIRYGQYGIYCNGSDLTISNNSISDSYYDGIYVNNASPRIIGGDITFNGRHGINLNSSPATISSVEIRSNGIRGTYHGIYGSNSAPTIENCTIHDNNGSGVYVTGSTRFTISGNTIFDHTNSDSIGIISSAATIVDNVITGNTYPLAVTGRAIFTYSGNTISGNTYNTAMGVFGDVNGIFYNSDNLPEPLTAYVVISNVNVPANRLLLIQPSVVVKFLSGQYLYIYGALVARASEGSEIVFTSFKDDEYGGDTNADGNASIPEPNDWGYLYPNGAGSSGSVLNYAIIRYGNRGIYCSGSDLTISNSDISYNYYDGIYVNNASPRIIGGDIAFNRRNGIYLDGSLAAISSVDIGSNGDAGTYHGIYGRNSAPTINNCAIHDNSGSGVYVTGSTRFTISGNTISGHTNDNQAGIVSSAANIADNVITGNTYPLMVTGRCVAFTYSGNTISGNTYNTAMGAFGDINGILYNSDNLPEPLTAYVVIGNMNVPANKLLLIQPGAVVKFLGGQYLYIYGTLMARASEGSEIVFTSFKDDEYGGDTNADGNASIPEPNDWGYLYPNGAGSSGSVLNYAIIRYGNRGIYCSGSDLTVSNNSISYSYYDGIYVSNASPKIINGDIAFNRRYGIQLDSSLATISSVDIGSNGDAGTYHGIYGRNSAPTINNCAIHDNSGSGVYVTGSTRFTISGNTISGHTNDNQAGIVSSAANIADNVITGNTYPLMVTGRCVAFTYSGNTISGNTYNTAMGAFGDINGILYNSDNLPEPLTAYVVIGNMNVPANKLLLIQPGAVVKFLGGQYLYIYGTLMARASEGSEIAFTSFKDDEYGGDTNADGNASIPEPNDWGYLYPNGANSSGSVIDYCIIRYGSYGIYCSGSDLTIRNSSISNSHNDGIYVNNASPRIIGGDITFNGRHGINLNSASPTISSVEIQSNGIRGTYHGIYGRESAPTISKCTIYDNSGSGVYVTGSTRFTISGNTISGHTNSNQAGIASSAANIVDNVITGNTYPLAVSGNSDFAYSGNTISGNTYNTAIGALGDISGVFYNSTNLPSPLTAYVVIGNANVPSNKLLLIQPGAVVKFLSGQYLYLYGTLTADASGGSEIAFTSFKDDVYGGDTNDDDNTSTPAPNDWGYLYPNGVNSSGSVIDHCIIRYGNRGIHCSGSDLTISNNSISDSYYDGIYITNASPGISGNIIESNGRYGIYFNPSSSVLINNSIINNDSYGVYLNGSSQPTIGSDPAELVNWNDIHGNDTYDLYNNTSNDIVACPIYWGTLDQTDIEMRIYDQEDNPAKGKVNCIPWTNAEHDTLYDGTSKASPTRLPVVELNKVKTNNVEESLPDKFSLLQNYPNPFNPDTWIPYSLPQSADVTIRIYNVSGNVVRKINLAHQAAGFYLSKDKAIYWNGRNDYGEKVPSGVYFYQIKAGKFISVKKAVIAK